VLKAVSHKRIYPTMSYRIQKHGETVSDLLERLEYASTTLHALKVLKELDKLQVRVYTGGKWHNPSEVPEAFHIQPLEAKDERTSNQQQHAGAVVQAPGRREVRVSQGAFRFDA
jgi:hypothetical protein